MQSRCEEDEKWLPPDMEAVTPMMLRRGIEVLGSQNFKGLAMAGPWALPGNFWVLGCAGTKLSKLGAFSDGVLFHAGLVVGHRTPGAHVMSMYPCPILFDFLLYLLSFRGIRTKCETSASAGRRPWISWSHMLSIA